MKNVGKNAKPEIERVKQLSDTNKSLRAFFDQTEEKLKKIRAENKELLVSLDVDEEKEKDKEEEIVNNVISAVVQDQAKHKPKGNVKTALSALKKKCSDYTQTETKPPTEKVKKELEDCRSSLAQLKLENEDLSSQLQLVQLEFSEQQKTKDAELDTQKISLTKVKNDLDKEREEKRILQEKCSDYTQTEKLKEELEECRSSLAQLKLKNEDLSTKFRSARSEFSEQKKTKDEELETHKRLLTKVKNDLEKEREEKRILQEKCSDNTETEKLKEELEECRSSLAQLKLQNEDLSSQLKLQNEDLSSQLKLVKSELTKLQKTKDEELRTHMISLSEVKNDLERESKERHRLQEELKGCKELLDDYSECQLTLMEQTVELSDELQVVHGKLERVDSELTDKTYEGSELELELHMWRTIAERMKAQYEESQRTRRKLEASLLAQSQLVEIMMNREKEGNYANFGNIEKQIAVLDTDDDKASKQSQICEGDQQEQEQLAGELEEVILAHIMKEKNYTQLPIVLELMRSELSEIGPNEQLEEIEAQLMGQMEKGSLAKTMSELEREHKEKLTLQEELNKYREMLDESTECQLTIIEHACDTEKKLINQLQEVQGALQRVDSELTDTAHERTELELELEVWKSTAARLQIQLEESQAIRKQLEGSLMSQQWVGGEQNTVNRFKNTAKIVNGDEQEQELLVRELEQAILDHTMKERNYTQQSLVLTLTKSEFSEVDAQSKEKENSCGHLMKQLEMKNDSLAEVQAKLEKECKEKLTLKEELEKYKEMLDESSKSQLSLMQQAEEMETQLTDELLEVHDVLDCVDSQLTDKTNEGTELEFELQVWKSIAERLNVQVEESQVIRKKLEASLLAVQTEFENIPAAEIHRNHQSNINKILDDDEEEQELLAKQLEQEILTHIVREKCVLEYSANLKG